MSDVVFATGQGVFTFDEFDVQERLSLSDSRDCLMDYADSLDHLKRQSDDAKRVPEDNGDFAFITLDLLGKKKGHAFCNACQKSYPALGLLSNPIGLGKYPYTERVIKEGTKIRAILRRKIKEIGVQGGEKFECPKGCCAEE